MDYTMQQAESVQSKPFDARRSNRNVIVCPECPAEDGYEVIEEYSSGDWVCTGCGLALEKIIDDGAEWRTFANDDGGHNADPSRVGGNYGGPLGGDDGSEHLVTVIGGSNKTSSLARAEKRGQNWNEKGRISVQRGYAHINDFCDAHDLTAAAKNQAIQIYRLIKDENVFRGKSNDALVGAAVFLACRQVKQPVTFRQVHNWTGLPRSAIASVFKELERFLLKKESRAASHDSDDSAEGARPDTKVGAVKELLARFVANLAFKDPFLVESTAIKLAEKAEALDTPFHNRVPTSLAAAYLYAASYLVGEPRSRKDVSECCSVTQAVIRDIMRAFIPMKGELVDEGWKGVDVLRLEGINQGKRIQ